MSKVNYFIFCIFLCFTACQQRKSIKPNIIPYPQEISTSNGTLDVASGFTIDIQDKILSPLADLIKEDYFLLVGKTLPNQNLESTYSISINKNLGEEEYQLTIDENIQLSAGSYQAAVYGITSIWQLLDSEQRVEKVSIKDKPAFGYRSWMIDCARGWHPIEDLKKMITLARWYKIRYLHLHLTDDQLFTFQSDHFPALATEGNSYSKTELKALNQYAYERGVILVPEIDIPAHASQFTKKMPELFGIADLDKNRYTMSMGKESVYEALDTLFGELSETFSYSPYLHIGGDEAHFDGMEDDPETVSYLKEHNLKNIKELFNHFIIRLNEIVKGHGKQTLVWAGFSRSNPIKIPTDVIVLSWESQYYNPQHLLDDGYSVINASWKPLYIVNNRKWSVEHIYTQWNEKRWDHADLRNKYFGMETKSNKGIKGASMCSWEQSTMVEVRRARKRLAAFSEKIWGSKSDDFISFSERLKETDSKLERLLYPFQVEEKGLSLAKDEASNFYEHLRFDSTLVVSARSKYDGLSIRYTNIDEPISAESTLFTTQTFEKNASIKLQAFDEVGNPVGHPFSKKYYFYPLQIKKSGLEIDRMASSWERLRFEDSLLIELTSPYPDYKIAYSIRQDNAENIEDFYTKAIKVDKTTHFSARLMDLDGHQIGSSLSETYYLIKGTNCLTTNKPTTASNEDQRAGMANIATNGRVSLWEHWSDLTKEENWIKVDLQKVENIERFEVYFFWDNYRYYQYTIDVSVDGEKWTQVVDASENTELASIDGYRHEVVNLEGRYLRLNVLRNSANPGLHVSEFCAW